MLTNTEQKSISRTDTVYTTVDYTSPGRGRLSVDQYSVAGRGRWRWYRYLRGTLYCKYQHHSLGRGIELGANLGKS